MYSSWYSNQKSKRINYINQYDKSQVQIIPASDNHGLSNVKSRKSALNTCQSVRRPLTHLLDLLQIQFHLLAKPFGKLLPLGLDAFAVWQ